MPANCRCLSVLFRCLSLPKAVHRPRTAAALLLEPGHEKSVSRQKRARQTAMLGRLFQRYCSGTARCVGAWPGWAQLPSAAVPIASRSSTTHHRCSAGGGGGQKTIGRAGLSALSEATGSAGVDEEYWVDTCAALEVDPAGGMGALLPGDRSPAFGM